MDEVLRSQVTRRSLVQYAAWCASVMKGMSQESHPSPKSPFDSAIAVWHMADAGDEKGRDGSVVLHGGAQLGIALTGEDKRASLKRGGDGLAASFDDGWLDAEQGADGKLNLTGNALTIAMRLRAVSGEWGHPLFSKAGGETREAYRLFSSNFNNSLGPTLAGEIGSDEVAGMHRVEASVNAVGPTGWHDVVMRFDGSTLELFVDGALRDDEAAVGTLRTSNREPCLIGAAIETKNGPVVAGFKGLVDYVALWNRALSNAEVAKLSAVTNLSDKRPVYYREKYRPQFHFSAQKHWINDPNGLVYYQGTYHLFFQHMPPGRPGAYKDWGHAVSTDLVHWKQVRTPITPHKLWGGCWSGSAVVDWKNTAGFQTGTDKTIIAIVTMGGEPAVGPPCTQCIAYSTDGGMTFNYYEQNPVLAHIVSSNRDPKVIWHAPTNKWVMCLYFDKNDYAIFGSPDLKNWERLCNVNLPDVIECPDLFELSVDGDPANKKWVFWGASGGHVIGTFDGQTYRKESDVQQGDYGNSFYAAQSWNDIPAQDGRRIQIAWLRNGEYPEMPFTQQMNFPTEVLLRTTEEGIRLYRTPVRELEQLRMPGRKWSDTTLKPGENPFSSLLSDAYEIRSEIELLKSSGCGIKVRGALIHFDAGAQTIACLGHSAPLRAEKGRIRLQILVDRTSLEIFCNGGRIVLSSCFLPPDNDRTLAIYAAGSEIRIVSADFNPLRSIWS